jgi:histidyl-tRNA synthetase
MEKFSSLEKLFNDSSTGKEGIKELQFMFSTISNFKLQTSNLEPDFSLARGLNYYTGAIIEVKANDVQIGSICGGGRYDDLTGIFGLSNVSGVGISFGADRIYDVMNEKNLFPDFSSESTQLLFVNFGEKEEMFCLKLLADVRKAGINAELYPDRVKIKKQMSYADDRKIPFVAFVGEEEMKTGNVKLKDMKTGEEHIIGIAQLADFIGNK